LPFDFAQGGELVEPFEFCDLGFGIYSSDLQHRRETLNLPNHEKN
jgi:hypothetical protein